jgi:hypothetical protein
LASQQAFHRLFHFCNMTIQLSTAVFSPTIWFIRSINPVPLLTPAVMCIGDYRLGLDRWSDLLKTCRTYLQVTIVLSLPHTLHSSL